MKRSLNLLKSKIFIGIIVGAVGTLGARQAVEYTSTDHFCEICHVHPQATASWKLSPHYSNPSGTITHCVDCHLPPGGLAYLYQKARLGGRDLYGKLFLDVKAIDWDERSKLEHALDYTFEAGCLKCHNDLFPPGLSERGATNHRQYQEDPAAKPCLDCHLHVGHFHEGDQFAKKAKAKVDAQAIAKATSKPAQQVVAKPAAAEEFCNYTERIPGAGVEFGMIALPGGTFLMGSPDSEPDRRPDEGPVHAVTLSPFWIAKTEVTWDQYEAFYAATATEGRSSDTAAVAGVDAVTGPTPPWGDPGQGWGRGERPASTMSHLSATTYCKWLSRVTGKKYRLPTEAEWEYACRGGTKTPFFFDPASRGPKPFAFYNEDSDEKTQPVSAAAPNPFGLLNMAGNVCEFCLDWYDPKAYSSSPPDVPIVNPRGPKTGKEHVIRGGSFLCGLSEMRSAARDYTRHDDWVRTDPQIPKSIWWYSDSIDVGFRVVREREQETPK